MKAKIAILTLFSFLMLEVNQPEGWELFENVKFTPTYFEEVDAYFDVPTFDDALKALENKEVTLSGYFLPIEVDTIFVLSANPFSSCFFCGGAGPETVAEVRMSKIPEDLTPDAFIKVKGTLKLNNTDIDYMNFIIREAEFIK